MTSTSVTLDEALAMRREAARGIVNVDVPMAKMVVFEIGGESFALRGAAVTEILPYTRVFHVPGCPEVIEGAINVRGDIESVIRLGALLGMQDCPPERHTSILLVHGAGMRSGLRVARIVDVVDVPETAIAPTLATVPDRVKPVAGGTVLHRDRATTVLEADLLFKGFHDGGEGAE